VPRDELPRAVAMTSLAYQSAAIIGPAVGGFLLIHSSTAAYGGAAAAYACATLLMWLIRTDTRPQRQPGSRVQQIKDGLAYVWTNKIVLGAISLDLFAVLLGGATA